jgi:ankyrin repeat protein
MVDVMTADGSMLLDHGALVNRVNSGSGTTAFYAAASVGKGETVKLLPDRGANPGLCGSNRKSAYQTALENGYSEVATQIRNRGGAGNCEKQRPIIFLSQAQINQQL